MSPEQPGERAATIEDIRAEVLTPDRLNTVVFGIFARSEAHHRAGRHRWRPGLSVSARTRELGIRLALGSPSKRLLAGVIGEGVIIAVVGVVAGGLGGYWLARFAERHFPDFVMPSAFPMVGSALVLLAAAVIASALAAARAARVDVRQALRSD